MAEGVKYIVPISSGLVGRVAISERPAFGITRSPGSMLPVDSYFEHDIIIAADIESPERFCEPEKKLMFYILEDAIHQLWHGKSDDRREARRWIERRGTSYIFSFETICEYIGYNAEAIRKAFSVS